MPDPNNTSLITFQDWTLRVREPAHPLDGPSPRLLLLIHGLTGDENSMWVFARDLPSHDWMVAPRAMHPSGMEQGGYSWCPPRPDPLERPSLEQLRPAIPALMQFVDEYAGSLGRDAGTFDVMGFSQGGALANALAFLYPARVRKVGILAGFVPSGLEELAPQRPLESKRFIVVHGIRDDRVSVEHARASIEILERAGAAVTYCEDDVGHKVSMNCLRALKQFFTDPSSEPVN